MNSIIDARWEILDEYSNFFLDQDVQNDEFNDKIVERELLSTISYQSNEKLINRLQ